MDGFLKSGGPATQHAMNACMRIDQASLILRVCKYAHIPLEIGRMQERAREVNSSLFLGVNSPSLWAEKSSKCQQEQLLKKSPGPQNVRRLG